MKFNPKDLQNKLVFAIKSICVYIDDMSLFEESLNLTDDEFELDEFDEEISEQSEIKMFFPDYDDLINIQAKYIISLADELNKTKLVDDLECFSDNKYMLKVEAEEYHSLINLDASLKADNTGSIESGLCTIAILDGKKYTIRILRGSALFRLLYAKDNIMHNEAPSSAFDYFIEISSEQKIESIDIKRILNSYLFELATTMKIRLKRSPLPTFHNEYVDEGEIIADKLRPLLFGPGVEDVITIYNNALESFDANIRVLTFTKVFEHISQTILREQIFDKVSNKLDSPKALNPDINYILELENLFEEHKMSKKDKQAVTLTILKCCDAKELSKISPAFLVKMNELKIDSKEKERELALKEFAEVLVDTRNSIAHAKSNYIPTGRECPDSELFKFSECVELATEQAIRSFYRIPANKRV